MVCEVAASAFAAKWLISRIERIQAACPETDVRLNLATRSLEFATHGIDCGVRYGRGSRPGLAAQRCMGEDLCWNRPENGSRGPW